MRAALDADPDPDSVFAIVGTGGTTNTGRIDDLAGIADVARERDLWFHVDGAYGLAALAAPSVRDRFGGIEHADSLVVDPHKWLFAPFDCAALLYRDPELARRAHTQHAAYLDAIQDRDEWNPSDYAYHLTRRARGLPFWFSLAVNGTDAYRAAIERTLEIARDAADRIDAAPHLELVQRPELGVVLWRRPGWSTPDYTAWSSRLLRRPAGVLHAHDLAGRDRGARRVPQPRVPARDRRRPDRVHALTLGLGAGPRAILVP